MQSKFREHFEDDELEPGQILEKRSKSPSGLTSVKSSAKAQSGKPSATTQPSRPPATFQPGKPLAATRPSKASTSTQPGILPATTQPSKPTAGAQPGATSKFREHLDDAEFEPGQPFENRDKRFPGLPSIKPAGTALPSVASQFGKYLEDSEFERDQLFEPRSKGPSELTSIKPSATIQPSMFAEPMAARTRNLTSSQDVHQLHAISTQKAGLHLAVPAPQHTIDAHRSVWNTEDWPKIESCRSVLPPELSQSRHSYGPTGGLPTGGLHPTALPPVRPHSTNSSVPYSDRISFGASPYLTVPNPSRGPPLSIVTASVGLQEHAPTRPRAVQSTPGSRSSSVGSTPSSKYARSVSPASKERTNQDSQKHGKQRWFAPFHK